MAETTTLDTTTQETTTISLSKSAADKLAEIMEERGLRATHALRVFVSGSSCSGVQYGMAFDGSPRETDTALEQHGLRIVIDPQSILYMEGASIDYVDGPSGSGFSIENPNAAGCSGSGCSGCH